MRLVPVFLLLLGLIGQGIHAQEARTLTIRDAIQMALQDNLSLKQSATAVSINRITVRQSRAAFLPGISGSASASKTFVPDIEGAGGDLASDQGGKSVSASLSGNLNLFTGFGNLATLRQSQRNLSAQEFTYAFNRQQLIFQTVSQFLQLIQNLDFIGVAEENLTAQEQQLDLVEALHERGNNTIADVYQQRANVKQAELQLLTARQNYEVSRYTLLLTLGQQPVSPLDFKSFDVEEINSLLDTEAVNIEIDSVFPDRKDIQSQAFQVRAAGQQIRIYESGFWPTLSLFANISSDYNSLAVGQSFSKQFSRNWVAAVGLNLSVPIFDRLSTWYSVRQAKEQYRDQRLILDNLKLTVSSDYQQALLDYHTAAGQLIAAQAQYEYSRQALEVVEAQYAVSATTFVQLALARSQELSAHYQLIAAEYNQLLKYIAVFYQRGDVETAVSIFDQSQGG